MHNVYSAVLATVILSFLSCPGLIVAAQENMADLDGAECVIHEGGDGETEKFRGLFRVKKVPLRDRRTGEEVGTTDAVYIEGEVGFMSYKDTGTGTKRFQSSNYVEYEGLRAHVIRVDPKNAKVFDIQGKGVRVGIDFLTSEVILLGGKDSRLTLAVNVPGISLYGMLISRTKAQADDSRSYVTWDAKHGFKLVGDTYSLVSAFPASESAGQPKPPRSRTVHLPNVEPLKVQPLKTSSPSTHSATKTLIAKLFVQTDPPNARVRILNIKPRFYQGIEVKPGKYHIEVSAKGYESEKKWITLDAGDNRRLNIDLKKSDPTNASDVIKRDGIYVAYANGIVRDTKTGLEWVAGPDKDMNWDEANSWVNSLNLDGGGWRMPTRVELQSLYVEDAGHNRDMTSLLKNTGWWVWSSDTKFPRVARSLYYESGGALPYWGPRGPSNATRAFAVRSQRGSEAKAASDWLSQAKAIASLYPEAAVVLSKQNPIVQNDDKSGAWFVRIKAKAEAVARLYLEKLQADGWRVGYKSVGEDSGNIALLKPGVMLQLWLAPTPDEGQTNVSVILGQTEKKNDSETKPPSLNTLTKTGTNGLSKKTVKDAQSGPEVESLLPPFQTTLKGRNEVRVKNPNDFSVVTGVRKGNAGINLHVPANGKASVHVPDGKYDIFFVYSNKPDALFQGDSFTLNHNGVEIRIVKVVGGNYGIRRVK